MAPGGNLIARWDGAQWTALLSNTASGKIEDLTIYGTELIACGAFQSNDGAEISRIGRWDGQRWAALGDGLPSYPKAMEVFNDELIVAGPMASTTPYFLMRWNGRAWQELGDFNSPAHCLGVFNGQLIVGGGFTMIDGKPYQHIAAWDGQDWLTLGEGVRGGAFPCCGATPLAMAIYEGDLIVGGYFTIAGGQEVNCIARWDGAAWHPLGSGVAGTLPGWSQVSVNQLTVFNGHLIVEGEFTYVGGVYSPQVARWNGSVWLPMWDTVDLSVTSIGSYGDQLLVGTIGSPPDYNTVWAWQDCVGACCIGGDCLMLPHSSCQAEGGQFEGEGTLCLADTACVADLNNDCSVDLNDLLLVINLWGACPGAPHICSYADVVPPGGNGIVNVDDLLLIINGWGDCG